MHVQPTNKIILCTMQVRATTHWFQCTYRTVHLPARTVAILLGILYLYLFAALIFKINFYKHISNLVCTVRTVFTVPIFWYYFGNTITGAFLTFFSLLDFVPKFNKTSTVLVDLQYYAGNFL